MLVGTFLLFATAGVAVAHVEISPAEIPPGGSAELTVEAAAEKDIPAIEVRVEIPQGFEVTGVSSPPGWQGGVEGGSVVWSGGEIAPDRAEEFPIEVQSPRKAGRFVWPGFVTYQDGGVIKWTGPPGAERPAAAVEVTGGGTKGDSDSGHEDDHGEETTAQTTQTVPETGGPSPALLYGAVALALLGVGALLRRNPRR